MAKSVSKRTQKISRRSKNLRDLSNSNKKISSGRNQDDESREPKTSHGRNFSSSEDGVENPSERSNQSHDDECSSDYSDIEEASEASPTRRKLKSREKRLQLCNSQTR